ncbi:hypothetical protein ACG2LH_08045 [Zhouia sp. PK063]|uniref:hypothetical protein n=1 Tax=Zhouia sp. PK063 TaxID=3373602 RepID=UPI003795F346
METSYCPSCKLALEEEPTGNCIRCNYPFHGTEAEKSKHIGEFISQKGIGLDLEAIVKRCQRYLFIVTAIQLVVSFIGIMNNSVSFIFLLLNGFVVCSFFLCALFLKKNPVVFSIIPMAIVIMIFIVDYLFAPELLLSGIKTKLIILALLGYCVYIATKAEGFNKKFSNNDIDL